MRHLFTGLIILLLIAVLAPVTFNSCTKPKNTTDTVTKTVTDTVIKTVTDSVFGDTTNRHINDSLWAWYKFNGNLADSSGNNHLLTLNGGAALGEDVWGDPNFALNLPGGGAYASIPDGANFNSPNWTVSLFGMYRVQHIGFFFTKMNYSDALGFSLAIGTDPVDFPNTLRVNLGAIPEDSICTELPGDQYLLFDSTGNTLTINAWYHIVATFNDGVCTMYINGVQVAQQVEPVTQLNWCSSAPFNLGNWWSQDNGPAVNGEMDEVRIYTRAITAKEVSYLFTTFQSNL